MTKLAPSYSPIYCGLYPDLAKIFREHGYALAIHGSLQRDFDVVAIPWVENPDSPEVVVNRVVEEFKWERIGEPEVRHHGRMIFQIGISWGNCYLDLSFMPIKEKNKWIKT